MIVQNDDVLPAPATPMLIVGVGDDGELAAVFLDRNGVVHIQSGQRLAHIIVTYIAA
ncbi:hypothetical protein [Leifsonia sp. Root227]|uniref:hypothetical protein n=1 Tax=Leifsonia sp. Root227 TaxID=1736496 RepID=UPI000B0CB986|nr:hypothetical protein [Leifsonia sp. Root227]